MVYYAGARVVGGEAINWKINIRTPSPPPRSRTKMGMGAHKKPQ
jgi:hypothetical protein